MLELKNFQLRLTNYFTKKASKLLKNNATLSKKLTSTLEKLEQNPSDQTLKTHKIHLDKKSFVYSSTVTGDIRLIWNYDNNVLDIIELLDIGGHSGSNSVY